MGEKDHDLVDYLVEQARKTAAAQPPGPDLITGTGTEPPPPPQPGIDEEVLVWLATIRDALSAGWARARLATNLGDGKVEQAALDALAKLEARQRPCAEEILDKIELEARGLDDLLTANNKTIVEMAVGGLWIVHKWIRDWKAPSSRTS